MSATAVVRQATVIAALLAAWQLASTTGALSANAAPSPASLAGQLVGLFGDGALWSSIGRTAQSWAVGLGLSVVVAVPLGLLVGASDLAYRSTRFTIDFLRTIPPVALVPLALLLYGATLEMKLVLIVFGSVWPLLLQTMYGVHEVDRTVQETARAFRFRRRDLVLRVVLPSAAPFMATGLRLAATMSLLLSIGAELIGSAPGLGLAIGMAQAGGNIPRVYAFIVVSAACGLLMNAGLLAVERRVLVWHAPHREGVRA